jgi:outer membrane protein TolC
MAGIGDLAESHVMRLIAICLVLLLPGCTAFKMPRPAREAQLDVDIPMDWTRSQSAHHGDAGTGWLKTFADPELEHLVQEAIERNQNLRVAAARLKAAKEGTIIGRAGRLPAIGAGLGGSYSETSIRDKNGALQPFVAAEDYQLSLNASWEVDLWGRLANIHRATKADYEGQLADYHAARLSLAANTVKAWCNLTAARQQVELAEQTRESFDRNQRIVERNYKAGDIAASPLDVQFARNQLAAAERGLISQRLGQDEARRSLALTQA